MRKINFAIKAVVLMTMSVGFLLVQSTRAVALSDIDQVCSTGIAGSTEYSFIGTRDGNQVFVPTKNTLDAISVRIKTEIGNNAQVTAKVVKGSTAPGQIIAQKTQTITNNEEWVIFDFDDVPMELDQYAIVLRSAEPNHAVWKMKGGDCYARGYAVDGDTVLLDKDYGFAVYAYDTNTSQATPAPEVAEVNTDNSSGVSQGDGNLNTSGTQSNSSSSGSIKPSVKTIGKASTKTPSSGYLTPEEILRDHNANSGLSIGASMILTSVIALFVGFLILIGLIILTIIIIKIVKGNSKTK